jgi:parallel beta-helix repeat protein
VGVPSLGTASLGTVSLGTARQARSWTLWATVGATVIILMGSARSADANCRNGQITQTLTAVNGATLYDAMAFSTVPCTLSIGPGTWTAPSAPPGDFTISAGITVLSTAGPATTILQASTFTAVAIWPVSGSCPSGATLDGFTLEGPSGGVFVGAGTDISHPGCSSNQVTGVTLRNLVVSANTTPAGGQGLEFHGVQSSVIDSCTVVKAYANGILFDGGSNNNIVMNSAIWSTQTQHAIALQDSNDNVIVANTISGAAFDGILLNSSVGLAGPGSSRNRIERNNISGHKEDGITLTQASGSNYVGLNTAVSASYVPGSSTPPTGLSGVGIWVNDASNGNYLFGNDVSGSPENGIDVLTSRSTYLQGNTVHGNWGGGIWVANIHDVTIDPNAPPPQDTVLHGNNVFFNTSNGQIFFQGSMKGQAAYNYLSAASATQGGALAAATTTAFSITASDSIGVFENTVSEVGSRAFVQGATTNTLFFRNRFLKGTNIANPPQTDGRNGLTWGLTPASVQWDGGFFLGGNHWSEFSLASGNPDPSHPYTAIIGNTNGGPNVDRFPFQSETLQLPLSVPNSVTVVEPVAGSVLAAGTKKTIRWVGRGCAYVDIYYGTGLSVTLISQAFPNIGNFIWTVPPIAPGATYYVQVVCANSSDASLGVSGNSPLFSIASGNLVLLNPGRASRGTDGGTLRVAWKTSAPVPVDIFVKVGNGAETKVAPAVTGTFADITLPPAVSDSSHVTVRIQSTGNRQDQDSVDGYFMVRGTPAFATSLSGQIQIGSVQLLEWTGNSNSYLVDLDVYSGSTPIFSIAKNLPDFGSYTWFVPDTPLRNVTIVATFKDANGVPVGGVGSGTFGLARNTSAPPPTVNTAAVLHDLDGDAKTDLAVFRPSNGTWYVRYSSTGYSVAGRRADLRRLRRRRKDRADCLPALERHMVHPILRARLQHRHRERVPMGIAWGHSARRRPRRRRQDGAHGLPAVEWHVVHPVFLARLQRSGFGRVPMGAARGYPGHGGFRWRRQN